METFSSNRRLNTKLRGNIAIKELEIIHTKNSILFFAIPELLERNLDNKDLEKIYFDFLNLGRELYKISKDKDNISNIKYDRFSINLDPMHKDRFILKNKIDNIDIMEYTEKWAKKSGYKFMQDGEIKDIENLNSSIFLNIWDASIEEKLKKWCKHKIIPFVYDSYQIENNNYKFQINIERLIDLSIFIYLTIYSLTDNNEDGITFENLIDIKEEELNELTNKIAKNITTSEKKLRKLAYINILNTVIEAFEEINHFSLQGHHKIVAENKDQFSLKTEFDNVDGLVWYIFKLHIIDIANDDKYKNRARKIRINICDDCGIPFIGSKSYCDNCDLEKGNKSKRKSRKKLEKNIENIEKINNKYNTELPDSLKVEINNLLKLKACEKDTRKTEFDKLLEKLLKWERTHIVQKGDTN